MIRLHRKYSGNQQIGTVPSTVRMNEMTVLDWIQSVFWSPTMDTIMATVGMESVGVMILAAILAPLLIIKRYRRLAIVILIAIVILYAVSELLDGCAGSLSFLH